MVPKATDWQDFFDVQAPYYDQNDFTKNTEVEVQFLIAQLGLEPGQRVLDLGCGTGRHAIALASRGMEVVGVDFSTQMLVEARKKSSSVQWVQADVCEYRSEQPFDAVICLCETPINLLPSGKDPIQHALDILRTFAENLKQGGTVAFTALNAYAQIRQMSDEDVEQRSFDPINMFSQYLNELQLPTGPQTVVIQERLFIPPEIIAMLRVVGLLPQRVYGGTAGEWGERALKLDEIEALYIANKPS